MQSTVDRRPGVSDDWQFKGSFGVIQLHQNNLSYLYLGSGSFISYQQYSIECPMPNGSAHLMMRGNKLQVSCNQEMLISLNSSNAGSATLTVNGKSEKLSLIKAGSGIKFSVPAISNAEIEIK